MLSKTQKEKIIAEIIDKLNQKKIAIFSDFHGIAVAKMQNLRKALKKGNAEFKVIKKTLLNLAFKKQGDDLDAKNFEGELGVTFGYGDETNSAKILVKFGKENETFKIRGGILGNKIISDKDVLNLSKLPSKEVLIGQFVRALQSPIRGLAIVLQGNIKNFAVVLNKIKDKK